MGIVEMTTEDKSGNSKDAIRWRWWRIVALIMIIPLPALIDPPPIVSQTTSVQTKKEPWHLRRKRCHQVMEDCPRIESLDLKKAASDSDQLAGASSVVLECYIIFDYG